MTKWVCSRTFWFVARDQSLGRDLNYKQNTWDVLGDEWFGDLDFSGIEANIFLSSFVDVTELGALLFQLDFEYGMSVGEV